MTAARDNTFIRLVYEKTSMLQRNIIDCLSGAPSLGSAWLGAGRKHHASGPRNASNFLSLNQCPDAVWLRPAARGIDRVARTCCAVLCLDLEINNETCSICSKRGGLRPSSQPERPGDLPRKSKRVGAVAWQALVVHAIGSQCKIIRSASHGRWG